ncbi:MAG: hypothetical protein QF704_07310 [Anaerolineales bacterium]|nr:hypothetical protein [Anaerolineales bacterium]
MPSSNHAKSIITISGGRKSISGTVHNNHPTMILASNIRIAGVLLITAVILLTGVTILPGKQM